MEASENMLVADMASNKAIGAFGADALSSWMGSTTPPARKGMRVLTHCNTGRWKPALVLYVGVCMGISNQHQ